MYINAHACTRATKNTHLHLRLQLCSRSERCNLVAPPPFNPIPDTTLVIFFSLIWCTTRLILQTLHYNSEGQMQFWIYAFVPCMFFNDILKALPYLKMLKTNDKKKNLRHKYVKHKDKLTLRSEIFYCSIYMWGYLSIRPQSHSPGYIILAAEDKSCTSLYYLTEFRTWFVETNPPNFRQ